MVPVLFTFYIKSVLKLKKNNSGAKRLTKVPKNSSSNFLNPLTPNDPYRSRTAPLTSKRCILYIYSTNIGTEYFKHGICSLFFPLQNSVCFIILTYSVPVLFTFYIQGVLKLKTNNSGAKRLITQNPSSKLRISNVRHADRFRRISSDKHVRDNCC